MNGPAVSSVMQAIPILAIAVRPLVQCAVNGENQMTPEHPEGAPSLALDPWCVVQGATHHLAAHLDPGFACLRGRGILIGKNGVGTTSLAIGPEPHCLDG